MRMMNAAPVSTQKIKEDQLIEQLKNQHKATAAKNL